MANSTPPQNRRLLDNLIWLGVSAFLAAIVWITAELNTNPIVEERLPDRFEVQILVDDDAIVTNQPSARAFITLRAQASTFGELDLIENIQVVADARGIDEIGQQRITLQGTVDGQRQATITEIIPSQITLQLEQRAERFVPLRTVIVSEPPASVAVQIAPLETNQILVAGPQERVAQIDEAQLRLELAAQRESVDLELEPVFVDVDNAVVPGNSISTEPDVIAVSVNIEQRSDVREVRVTPNFINELPEGYTITSSFRIEPETAFVSGTPDVLEDLPSTLSTAPIDLSQYTNDFEIQVSLLLPDTALIPITGQQITVSVGIEPIQTSRQFESVAVDVIGLSEQFAVALTPAQVGVLVNGPQPVLSTLLADDVQVLVDLNAITEPGTYPITPIASVSAQIDAGAVEVLPPTIDVLIMPAGE